MLKIAIYGKGGIGKSTTASNISASFAKKGLKVMQIGCDPKADSTINLHGETTISTVLDLIRQKGKSVTLDEMVNVGYEGVLCVEAGGPTPGLGCAGRGIITAFEALAQRNAFEIYKPDVVIYDVLGDVVCGGFAMPIREGYAEKVIIVTSGENMALHAATNIAMAVDNFKERGYATLGGIILNKRNVDREQEKVEKLSSDIQTDIIGTLEFSHIVQKADELHKTVVEAFPDSEIAVSYMNLADAILSACNSSENE